MFRNFFVRSIKESVRISTVLISAQCLNIFTDRIINEIFNPWLQKSLKNKQESDKNIPKP
jgi:hypothetical protein